MLKTRTASVLQHSGPELSSLPSRGGRQQMPKDVQGPGTLQLNAVPASSCFECSRFPKPDVVVFSVNLSDSLPKYLNL